MIIKIILIRLLELNHFFLSIVVWWDLCRWVEIFKVVTCWNTLHSFSKLIRENEKRKPHQQNNGDLNPFINLKWMHAETDYLLKLLLCFTSEMPPCIQSYSLEKKKKTYSVKAKPTDYQVYYFLKHKKGLMQPAQRNEKRERKAALTSSTSGSSYCGSIFFSELGSALNLSAENINAIEPPLEYSLWNN